MYPRVKVREQEDTVARQEEDSSFVVRVPESHSIEDNCSPRITVANYGITCKSDYSPPHARISMSHLKNKSTAFIAAFKGNNDEMLDEDNKINMRANSVPRPRAVLSSPDNDGLIGSQKEQSRGRGTPITKQTLSNDSTSGRQSQQIKERKLPKVQGKPHYSSFRVESPLSTKKGFKEAGNSILKEKVSSELLPPRQRPPFK